MNEGIFTAYHKLPEWKDILTHIERSSSFSVSNIADGERAFVAAALRHDTGRPVLLITSGEKAAMRYKQDIERVFNMKVRYFPPRDLLFSRAAISRESTWQRIGVLESAKQTDILCAPVDALLDRCAPIRLFQERTIILKEGQILGRPDQLIRNLISCGYERVDLVEGSGQCAGRGSIVDVFPAGGDNALRIEFFDEEIDSIRRFDCISQHSIERIKKASIPPATECLVRDYNVAAERLQAAFSEIADTGSNVIQQTEEEAFLEKLDLLEKESDKPNAGELAVIEKASRKTVEAERLANRQRHLREVEQVRNGETLRNAPMWMNVLPENTSSIFDYFDNPILLLDCPNQFPSRIQAAERDFEDSFSEAAERGDAFEAQHHLRYNYDALLSSWKKYPCLSVSDAGNELEELKTEGWVSFDSVYSPAYQSHMEQLAKDVNDFREKGCTVLLLSGGEARGKRLESVLNELKAPCVYSSSLDGNLISRQAIILPVAFSKGFIHAAAGLCVLSDTDLYGTAYQRAKKKNNASERIASFTDLRVGDPVVHDLHGIGIFKGIVQRKDKGITRDYLQLEYAEGDKLLVPADQFDRIGKYIGADQEMPKLNYLGGGEWMRQKNKVRTTLKELAFSLAELYAKRTKTPGFAFSHDNPWQQQFNDYFPYELTEDQERSVAEIELDMETPRNMDRLLCGDVGYGKTEVAMRSAFKCIVDGKQVAMLAPTTVLVQQHYNTIRKRFENFPVQVEMLSRFRSKKQQLEILEGLKKGEIDIIVGTHALLSRCVEYKDLGLLIVDEEHRFGVNHKETIQHMKTCVDVLTLSATPIPRTLHMSMVGIRDMSLLESPPEERLPIKTYVLDYSDKLIQDAIRREMARGGQVYFLYNRVRSLEQMYDRIKNLVPDARIGIAHGQMNETALEDVMLDFYAGAYDVLLCTTIVENGLDVPSANTLIVFDADHFGLSQLYQIRGRVGRSSRQAYAYFTIRPNKQVSETAEKRLEAIREFTEFGAGYRIAMRDLEIRGSGDIFGPQQSGHMNTLGYDTYLKLIEEAVNEAQGKTVVPDLDTRVEMSISAFLPEDYITGENVRIEIYKRISMIQDENTRMEVTSELIDRFGDIPLPVENLIRIAQLRGITRKLGISNLAQTDDGLLMRLDPDYMPDFSLLLRACNDTDPRLKFSLGKTPVLLLCQKGLSASRALELGINVLDRLRERTEVLKESIALQKAECPEA